MGLLPLFPANALAGPAISNMILCHCLPNGAGENPLSIRLNQ